MIKQIQKSYRRHLYVFCMIHLLLPKLYGQYTANADCKTVHRFTTGIPSLENNSKCYFNPPYIYYFSNEQWGPEKKNLTMYSWQCEKNEKDSFIINLNENLDISSLPVFCINKNYLLLYNIDNSELYRFARKGKTYIYLGKIKTDSSIDTDNILPLKNDKFLLYSFYNYHPLDKKHNSTIAIYDAKSDNIQRIIHPDMPCIAMSITTNSWITVSENKIALANPCGYKIIFFNYNLEAIDSINYPALHGWKDLPENKIPFETDISKIHVKLLGEKIMEMKDTVSLIEKIFFTDENKLLVFSSGMQINKNLRRLEVWNIKKTKVPENSFPSVKINFIEKDTIDTDKLPLFINSPEQAFIKDNRLYTFDEIDFFPERNEPVKEFNHKKDLYYEKKDPIYTISVYKINPF